MLNIHLFMLSILKKSKEQKRKTVEISGRKDEVLIKFGCFPRFFRASCLWYVQEGKQKSKEEKNMKKLSLILLSLILVFAISACAQKDEAKAPEGTSPSENVQAPEGEEKEFTLDELAKFNGKDGNKAYVAVDGVVYDVTDVPPWKGGDHNGYEAGKDLTEEIKTKSPHGISKLQGVPVVGKLAK